MAQMTPTAQYFATQPGFKNASTNTSKVLATNPYYNGQNGYPQGTYGSMTPTFNYQNAFNQFGGGLGNQEARSGVAQQSATNVLDVRQPLSQTLANFNTLAQKAAAGAPKVSLSTKFADGNTFANQLRGGIDYFGNLGISEGLQNIGLQRETANRQLADMLGRGQGNTSLLGVLQNQNLMRSQLAGIPLISEAQRGTAERTGQMIDLQNTVQQLRNNTQLQQQGFNQQAQLAGMQPMQNLLEALSGLQGQQRGVYSAEAQAGAKNFK